MDSIIRKPAPTARPRLPTQANARQMVEDGGQQQQQQQQEGDDESEVIAQLPPGLFTDRQYYPNFFDFMTALQDPGRENPKSVDRQIYHPTMTKFAGRIYDQLKSRSFPNLPANRFRANLEITQVLLQLRSLVDKTHLHQEFLGFSPPDVLEVYILVNDKEYFGFDRFLRVFSTRLQKRAMLKLEDRSPADGIRAVAVMLHRDNRKDVIQMLSRKGAETAVEGGRGMVVVDPTMVWATEALKQFNDPNFVVPIPDEMDPDEVYGIDPNVQERIGLLSKKIDAKWFLGCWTVYVKKKYRAAMKRWTKEVESGIPHEPREFSDFCDKGNRWLVWVYLMDLANDLLLATHVSGNFINNNNNQKLAAESVQALDSTLVDQDIDIMDEGKGTTSSTPKRKRADISTKFFEERAHRVGLLLDEVTAMVSERRNRSTSKETDIINKICEANRRKKDVEEASRCMSPASRASVLRTVEKEIVQLGWEHKAAEAASTAAEAGAATESG